MHFEKKIDKRSRKSMTEFLRNHFRYYTLNSWNQSTSYANNVKIHNLPIPPELRDLAYDVAYGSIESEDFNFICRDEIAEFKHDTGYAASFNGRSSGYIVMIDTERNYTTGELMLRPGRSIDQYEDFDDTHEWDMTRLRERVATIIRFDRMCDNILSRFIDLLRNAEVETVTEVITKEHKVLQQITYFDIHVKYDAGDSDGYSIFITMPTNATPEMAVAKAKSNGLFECDDDINHIDNITEINREEYLKATANTTT